MTVADTRDKMRTKENTEPTAQQISNHVATEFAETGCRIVAIKTKQKHIVRISID